jgi:GT2 family glycosyltransferase
MGERYLEEVKMVNMTMQVRDRYNLTKQALDSLASSGMDNMTVTVLDDRSQDETRLFVEKWCVEHDALYMRNDEPLGTGPLRNAVMEMSRAHFGQGEYVAPHDNDVFFKPGWLETLVKAYKFGWDHGFRLIGAYGHPFHHPIGAVTMMDDSNHALFNILEVQALATQSMMMSWDVWDQYGPFCPTPIDKTCQSEDVDFTNKIRADGFKLGVVHPHLIHATALKNTFGEPGPGWEYVKAECPEGVICE